MLNKLNCNTYFPRTRNALIKQEPANLDCCLPEPILEAITEFRPRRRAGSKRRRPGF